MIQQTRITFLNEKRIQDRQYVLYWMQASQRCEHNHALEYAIRKANERNKPVVVFFGITDVFPEANVRHYRFMLEGLIEVRQTLHQRGIKMVIRYESPEKGVLRMSAGADMVVVDRGYLRIQKAWRMFAAERMDCPLIQLESDAVVPVEEASPKEEYAAATFRPKIKKKWDAYLVPLRENNPKHSSVNLDFFSFGIDDVDDAISNLRIDRSVSGTGHFRGGTKEAKKLLRVFIRDKLLRYEDLRNDPSLDFVSHLSPYLHFGQISPLYVALQVMKTDGPGSHAFLEELVVRRELAINYIHYNAQYDAYEGLPEWAIKTLNTHRTDTREYIYSLQELEGAKSHDPYWNAAQKEMMIRGKMHGYMRMYWGKKILEWSMEPETAFRTAIYLNNKYELDGRDPNAFTGVAWCFGKHDRAWAERPIFGKIRYMNANGLRRKFDIDKYVEKVDMYTRR